MAPDFCIQAFRTRRSSMPPASPISTFLKVSNYYSPLLYCFVADHTVRSISTPHRRYELSVLTRCYPDMSTRDSYISCSLDSLKRLIPASIVVIRSRSRTAINEKFTSVLYVLLPKLKWFPICQGTNLFHITFSSRFTRP